MFARVILIILSSLLMFAQWQTPAIAAIRTIYVDKQAQGLNNGSSWSNAFISLNNATSSFQVGATNVVLVAAGVYYEELSFAIPQQGSFGRTNIVRAYTNDVIIDGSGSRPYGIRFQDARYCRVEGFTVRNIAQHGVYFFVASNCEVRRLVIYRSPGNAIRGQGCYHNIVRNCTFWSNAQGAWTTSDPGCLFINNIVVQSTDFGLKWLGTGAVLDYNNIYGNNGRDYIEGTSPGPHDISADPLFLSTDPSSPQFLRLSSGSPCRNMGSDGKDIGAYPFYDGKPFAPSNFRAITVATDRISLSWRDLRNETCYTLFRGLSSNTNLLQKIAGLASNTSSFLDSDLKTNTPYFYRIRAYNTNGSSPFSMVAISTTYKTPPAIPNISKITATSYTQVLLQWENVLREDGYTIHRGLTLATNSAVLIAILPKNQTNYADNSVNGLTSYHYWIRATNNGGAKGFSPPVSVTTPPAPPPQAPSWIQSQVLGHDRLLIEWENVSLETSYTLYRSLTPDTNACVPIIGRTENITHWTDTGLTEHTPFHYWVKAWNCTGPSPFSSVTVSTTSNMAKPITPELLHVTPLTFDKVLVKWRDISNETSYTLYRSLSASTNGMTIISGFTKDTTNHIDSGLQESTLYYYRLKSFNPKGGSAFSPALSVLTPPWPGHIVYVSKLTNNPVYPFDTPQTSATDIQQALAAATFGTNTLLLIDNYQGYPPFVISNRKNITIRPDSGYTPAFQGGSRILCGSSKILIDNICFFGAITTNAHLNITDSKHITVSHSCFKVTSGAGLVLAGSSVSNIISDNAFLGCATGASIREAATANQIQNSVFSNCQSGILLTSSTGKNRITRNFLKQCNTGIKAIASPSNSILSNHLRANLTAGLHDISSSGNVLRNNRFASNQGKGVWLDNTLRTALAANHFMGNSQWGLHLDSAVSCHVGSNRFNRNTLIGAIALNAAFSNTFSRNLIWSNNWAYYLYGDCRKNLISHDSILRSGTSVQQAAGSENIIRDSIIAWGGFGISGSITEDYNTVYGHTFNDYNGATPGMHSVSLDPQFSTTDQNSPNFLRPSFGSPISTLASDGTELGAMPMMPDPKPPMVQNFKATTIPDGTIRLTWDDTENETSYRIYISLTNNTNAFTWKQDASENSTCALVDGLISRKTYYFRISASNSFGRSPLSAVISASSFRILPPEPRVKKGFSLLNNFIFSGEPSHIYITPENSQASGEERILVRLFTLDGMLIRTISDTKLAETPRPLVLETGNLGEGIYLIIVEGAGIRSVKRLHIRRAE